MRSNRNVLLMVFYAASSVLLSMPTVLPAHAQSLVPEKLSAQIMARAQAVDHRQLGSFYANTPIHAVEVQIHYPWLADLLDGSSGFFDSEILTEDNFLSPDYLHQFTLELQEIFKTKKTYSAILDLGDQKVTLSISRDGELYIVDSSGNASNPVSVFTLTKLRQVLSNLSLRDSNHVPVVFTEPQFISTNQGKDGYDSAVFALLNAFQVAKSGDLNAYQQVNGSLSSRSMSEFEDIRHMDSHSFQADAIYDAEDLSSFFASFQRKTRELLHRAKDSVSKPESKVEFTPTMATSAQPSNFGNTIQNALSSQVSTLKRVIDGTLSQSGEPEFLKVARELQLRDAKETLNKILFYHLETLAPADQEYILILESELPDSRFQITNPLLTDESLKNALFEIADDELNGSHGLVVNLKQKLAELR